MSKSKKKSAEMFQVGGVLDGWVLEAKLGAGGNGDVWKAARPGQASQAIKILRSVAPETYERFKVETGTLEKLGRMPGIIPLLEKFVPENKFKATHWFTMPIAVPFEQYIEGRSPFEIVEDFIALAMAIETLHKADISHRDIKDISVN